MRNTFIKEYFHMIRYLIFLMEYMAWAIYHTCGQLSGRDNNVRQRKRETQCCEHGSFYQLSFKRRIAHTTQTKSKRQANPFPRIEVTYTFKIRERSLRCFCCAAVVTLTPVVVFPFWLSKGCEAMRCLIESCGSLCRK